MTCATAAPQSTMIHSPLSSPSVREHRHAARLHRIAHARCQRLGLPVAGARRDDHALEQRRQVLGVEDDDVLGLHVFQAIDDGALQLADVHSARWRPLLVKAVQVNIARDRGRHQIGDRLAAADRWRGCRSTRSSIIGSGNSSTRCGTRSDLRVPTAPHPGAARDRQRHQRDSSSRQSRQVCSLAYWSWPRIEEPSASGARAACSSRTVSSV